MAVLMNPIFWIIIVAIVVIMALIGYLAEGTDLAKKSLNSKKKQKTTKTSEITEIESNKDTENNMQEDSTWSSDTKEDAERQEVIHTASNINDWNSMPQEDNLALASDGINNMNDILAPIENDQPQLVENKTNDNHEEDSSILNNDVVNIDNENNETSNLVEDNTETSELSIKDNAHDEQEKIDIDDDPISKELRQAVLALDSNHENITENDTTTNESDNINEEDLTSQSEDLKKDAPMFSELPNNNDINSAENNDDVVTPILDNQTNNQDSVWG